MATMDQQAVEQAKAVWAGAEKASAGRCGGVVDDVLRAQEQGDAVAAETWLRTLDEVGGHYVDGRFVGAAKIVAASKLLRAYARYAAYAPPDRAAELAVREAT